VIINNQLGYFAQSQDQALTVEPCNSPKIEWINEISSESVNSENSGLINSIYTLIVGSDEIQILRPFSIVSDSNNNIYFIDQDSKKLIKYSFTEKTLESLIDEDIELKSPVGLCLTDKDLFFTDSETNNIYKYNLETEETKITNSSIQQPTGIIYINETKQLWVCETKRHRIVKLNLDGDMIGTLGERGIDAGQFNFPTFLCLGNDGNVYINDSMNFRVQVFSGKGNFVKQFGKAGDGSGDFARPKGIATDSFNNIYVVDALFNSVQVFDHEGRLLYIFGEQGTDSEKFWLPAGIFIDDDNRIYVADTFNSRIQVFQLRCVN
jgi:DNA-binding beta-propeller fold protein YncE